MEIRPTEITEVLKQELEAGESPLKMDEVGRVLQVGDGVARIYGLGRCMMNELLEFPGGVMGIALNLEQDSVGAILMGPDEKVHEGDEVRLTGRIVSVPVGDELLGRVVDALGQPIDGKGPLLTERTRHVESPAPGVIERQPVQEPLQTGIKAIDSMIPIGRGQRELIIGDRQTGKTAILVDTILAQRDTDVVSIYVAIGQKLSTVLEVQRTLERYGAMKKTIIVSAPASDRASMQFLAPFSGCTMGEDFRDRGKHAVAMYDDLYKHATAWRQVSLLLRRPPGREAFPGDIFNLHSRLLERAAKMSDARGGGSLTALPVVETQEGDYSAYIPTNVISITDGQIYLQPELFHAGIRPAVNVGISVSRVGGNAQTKGMKKIAGGLRIDLAQYREVAAFAQFGSDLDAATQRQLNRGRRLEELLKQGQYAPMPWPEQVAVLFGGTKGLLDDVPVDRMADFEAKFLEHLRGEHAALLRELETGGVLTDDISQGLEKATVAFVATFTGGGEG